ncbi:hypothetical protein AMJ80_07590 [bacterium SM23_31]|nr:MAG: hypothetical protein AMJ80_07590 [bacterium SM23_31]
MYLLQLHNLNKAVFIVGPTGMDIGTDKPPREILERIPHHFIDILQPDECYNSGLFGKDVRKKIDEIISRNRLPFIVGGSGLYIKSILEGFFDEKIKDPETKKKLQERARKEGNDLLYKELREADPEFAARISVNDTQRIVRGLEVFMVTGKPLTHHWQEIHISLHFQPVLIGLRKGRDELYDIINKRVGKMLEEGLIDEVKTLRRKGFSPDNNALQTYGYREVFNHLDGAATYDEMVEQIKKRTRNFAKRQMTWFKKMRNITWIDVGDDKEAVVDIIINIITIDENK